jgi:glycosyltransferase involved in cell wall biosynthesis
LASYLQVQPDIISQIVVIDFGSQEPVRLQSSDPRFEVVRVEAKVWSLAEATNIGVLYCVNDVIFKTDADIFMPGGDRTKIIDALRAVAERRADVALFRVRDLPPEYTASDVSTAIRQNLALPGTLRSVWGQGCLAFSRSIWSLIGGYDSRLTGWGLEDNDFCDRARRAGGKMRWVPASDGCLLHVWHLPQQFHPNVSRRRNRGQDAVRRDRSILRPLHIRHASGLPAPRLASIPPHVSVAIATSDRPGRDRMMLECIRSFAGQIDNDFEVDILDNGSSPEASDRLQKLLEKLPGSIKVRFWREEYRSIAKARNQLAIEARGRFTAIMDDDDLSMPNRLRDHMVNFDQDPGVHGSHGGWIDFDQHTGLVEYNPGKNRTLETMMAGAGTITAHSTCLYRTDVLRLIPYDEALDLGSDWDLATRMALMGTRVAHTGTYVTLRRFHGTNVTLTLSSQQYATGQDSRSRAVSCLSVPARLNLTRDRKLLETAAHCVNTPDYADILGLLPSAAGVWHLMVDATDIYGAQCESDALDVALGEMEFRPVCLKAGIGEPVVFLSRPIKGAGRGMKEATSFFKQTGLAPTFISPRQVEILAETGFEWNSLHLGEGEVLLISDRYDDLEDLLVDLAKVPPNSLLRASLRIVSDSNDAHRCYYIVGPKGPNSDEVRALRTKLAQHGLTVGFGRSPGTTHHSYSRALR